MIEIYHKRCGQPAFKYRYLPVAGERILRKDAFHLDGDPIGPNETMFCESCGRPISNARALMPSPPKEYDMTSSEDMQELYGTAGIDDYA
jgi:hypothetical protein